MLYGTQIEVHLPSHDRKEVVDWPILQDIEKEAP